MHQQDVLTRRNVMKEHTKNKQKIQVAKSDKQEPTSNNTSINKIRENTAEDFEQNAGAKNIQLSNHLSLAKSDYSRVINDSLIELNEYLKMDLPDLPYYLTPWLRRGSIAMIFAKAGIGKTWIGLTIAAAVTHHLPIGPWNVDTAAGVLYVDGEMSCVDLQDRLDLLTSNLADDHKPLGILSADIMQSKNVFSPNLNEQFWRDAITEYLENNPQYRIIILDNLSCLTPGIDENKKEDWDDIDKWLLQLRFKGISAIIIHHAGKQNKQRGTSAREDHFDAIIKISNNNKSNSLSLLVQFEKIRGARGPGIKPFILNYNEDNGGLIWNYEKYSGITKKDLIIAMLGKDIQIPKIMETTGTSKSYISQVKTKAINEGYLDLGGLFTDTGKTKYGKIKIPKSDV